MLAAGQQQHRLRSHDLADALGNSVLRVKLLSKILGHDPLGCLRQGNNMGVQIKAHALFIKSQMAVHADSQRRKSQRAMGGNEAVQ